MVRVLTSKNSLTKTFAVAASVWAFACLPAIAGTVSLKEIREARVVIQQWDTSGAAVALATVFFGWIFAELVRECGAHANGSGEISKPGVGWSGA